MMNAIPFKHIVNHEKGLKHKVYKQCLFQKLIKKMDNATIDIG